MARSSVEFAFPLGQDLQLTSLNVRPILQVENKPMDFSVFLAVLLAAACHAGWNALIKGSDDRLTTAGFVAMASGLVSLLLLPIVGLPNAASIPWAIGAALVHLLYFVCLIEAYDHGDLGQVYPLVICPL